MRKRFIYLDTYSQNDEEVRINQKREAHAVWGDKIPPVDR